MSPQPNDRRPSPSISLTRYSTSGGVLHHLRLIRQAERAIQAHAVTTSYTRKG